MQSISQRTAQMERGRAEKHAIAVAVLLSQLLQVTSMAHRTNSPYNEVTVSEYLHPILGFL